MNDVDEKKSIDVEMNDKGTDLAPKTENNEKEGSSKKSEDSDVEMKEKIADLTSNNITAEVNSKEDEKKSETDVEMKENGSDKDDDEKV